MLSVHEQKHRCEALYAEGRIVDAASSLLEFIGTTSEVGKADKVIVDWISGEFSCRSLEMMIDTGQGLRCNVSQDWKELETRRQTLKNMKQRSRPTLLHCLLVLPARTFY